MDRDLCTGPGPRHTFLEHSCSCSQMWTLPDWDGAQSGALGNAAGSAPHLQAHLPLCLLNQTWNIFQDIESIRPHPNISFTSTQRKSSTSAAANATNGSVQPSIIYV